MLLLELTPTDGPSSLLSLRGFTLTNVHSLPIFSVLADAVKRKFWCLRQLSLNRSKNESRYPLRQKYGLEQS